MQNKLKKNIILATYPRFKTQLPVNYSVKDNLFD
jgi:hypothetical protein